MFMGSRTEGYLFESINVKGVNFISFYIKVSLHAF